MNISIAIPRLKYFIAKVIDIITQKWYCYITKEIRKEEGSMDDKEKKDIRETVKMLMQLDKESLLLAKQSVNTIWAMERLHDKKAG